MGTGIIIVVLFFIGMYFFWKYKTKKNTEAPTGSGTNINDGKDVDKERSDPIGRE